MNLWLTTAKGTKESRMGNPLTRNNVLRLHS
jgi:hypothetical protein